MKPVKGDGGKKNISSTKKEYEQSKKEDNKKPESKSKWL